MNCNVFAGTLNFTQLHETYNSYSLPMSTWRDDIFKVVSAKVRVIDIFWKCAFLFAIKDHLV